MAGGDGTAAEVVSGLLGAALGDLRARSPSCRSARAPTSTARSTSRATRTAAIARLASGKGRRIDVGCVRYAEADGSERTSHFLNVASAGLSGVVTRHVRGSKALGARLAFLIGTLAGARAASGPRRCGSAWTAAEVYRGDIALAAVANGRYFGGGMHVAPEARPDDGLLDLVMIPALPKHELLMRLPSLYRGTHLAAPGVRAVPRPARRARAARRAARSARWTASRWRGCR